MNAMARDAGPLFVPACALPDGHVPPPPGRASAIVPISVCQVPKFRGVTRFARRVLIEAWVHANQVAHPHRPAKPWRCDVRDMRPAGERPVNRQGPFDNPSLLLTGGESP